MFFHKLISTSLGIGYIGKGAGTAAAVACCICWYFLQIHGFRAGPAIIFTTVVTLLGIWSAGKVEAIWGPDPNRVVIDEVAGMCISLLFLPVTLKYILLGLVLFRFFDIVKPLFIKKMENLPGGWGIMFDDILAGIYANILLQVVFRFNLL